MGPARWKQLTGYRRAIALAVGLFVSAAHSVYADGPAVGTISSFAGTGSSGFGGDLSLATSAQFHLPAGVAVDAVGNVYIADQLNHRVRKVTASTGIITTVAGSGAGGGYGGDGGLATAASLNAPYAVVVNAAGDLFIADDGNHRIRKVVATTGIITTVAGSSNFGTYSGDGGAATAAQLNFPRGIAIDAAGDLFISDSGNNRVRKVTAATGIITTVAGNGVSGFDGDGTAATAARLYNPVGVAVDGSGNIYIADSFNHRVRKVIASSGIISTVAGTGDFGFGGEGGPGTAAPLWSPQGVDVDASGNVYIADYGNSRIRKLTVSSGILTTVAGSGTASFGGNGGLATAAQIYGPTGVAVDAAGNLFIADGNNDRVRKVSVPQPTLLLTTIAGTGTPGYNGDGPATGTELLNPSGTAVDAAGDVYIADQQNHRIRKISAGTGLLSTIAGTGAGGVFSGDGGPATSARLWTPTGVAVDSARNVYITDLDNQRVRKIDAVTGVIRTVAGNGTPAFGGDGSAATAAQLHNPTGVAVDISGNVYIADQGNNRIRKVTAASGVITTIAGNGTSGSGGDGGAATVAQLDNPTGVAVDASGNIYIADQSNHRVRKVTAASGVIATIAGVGDPGFGGEAGTATAAYLNSPTGVAVDGASNVYIADRHNHRIRMVSAATGLITTVAGSGDGAFGGDGGAATAGQLFLPFSVAIDSAGSLFIADYGNHRIRRAGVPPTAPLYLTATRVAPTQIQLTWTAAPGGIGYVVKRGPSPGTETVLASGIGPTTYVTAGPVGTRYYFVVSALFGGGIESEHSNEVTILLTVPEKTDINGDGSGDILWRNTQSGANVVLYVSGGAFVSQASLPAVPDPAWQLVASADLTADGHPDLIWRNNTTGANVVWVMNGLSLIGQVALPAVPDLAWRLAVTADLNQDGSPDLIWRNYRSGYDVVWYMSGTAVINAETLPVAPGLSPTSPDLAMELVGSADINQDGAPDFIWRSAVSGVNLVWYLNGTDVIGVESLPPVVDPAWQLMGAQDVTGDGLPDLIWRNRVTGANLIWALNGTAVIGASELPMVVDQTWSMIGPRVPRVSGDLNADRFTDLVWRNAATGANVVWFMNGTTFVEQTSLPTVPDSAWQRVAVADFDGNSRQDLLWRNTTTGANVIWFMDGTTVVSQGALQSVTDLAWRIVAAVDVNRDTYPDLIWRNSSTGANVVWFLRGTTFLSQASLPAVTDLAWTIAGAADLNGDTYPDLVWRNQTTGANVVWYLSGTTFLSQASLVSVPDLAWQIGVVADIDGDTHPDLVWRNTSTGANVVWTLNGHTFLGQTSFMAVPDTNWTLHP